MAVVNRDKLIPYMNAYLEYLSGEEHGEKTHLLSNNQEDYKRKVAKSAAVVLDCDNWTEREIGNGYIGDCAIKAVRKNQNLIGRFQVTGFSDSVKENLQGSERVLFDLYKEHKEEECFERICKLFGRKYDLVSYIYFILDSERYLPLRPSIFDKIFRKLGIEMQLSDRCSWDNYCEFIETVSNVRDIMREYFKTDDIDLIDTHSFLWTLNYDEINEWFENKDADNTVLADGRAVGSTVFHKEFGEGTIIKINEADVYVEFKVGVRIFPYPKAFEKDYLI